MRIAVFGANGNTGSRVIAEGLSRGHDMTAIVRDTGRAGQVPSGAVLQAGDAARVEDVATLARGQDVVIAATRPAPGKEGDHAIMMRALLAGTVRADVRLLVVGGAASLIVPGTGGVAVIDDPRFVPPEYRAIAQASNEQFAACLADKDADWTYLSPPALLEPGERTGTFRRGTDELVVDDNGRSAISMEDFAIALIDEAEQARHRRARFTVGY
ncbi:NAD(P)-dependent oxidoreductase [Nitratireductor soli]|uniref:NAD(P)-dependent oxidoreductase n=1 Tax=Nitratireductor soli TaxID=1670619 RepID=UPI00065E5763|nr:NAD(P)H-binding protein [Nitratireductor soli]